jgi:hypothetical protein
LLLEHKKFKADFDVEYTASFWHYNKGSFVNCVTAITEECNEIGQNNDWTNMYNIGQASNIAGNWSLIELKFKLKQNGNTVAIFTKGNDKIDKIAYNDCLLIRPSDVDVYQIVKSQNGATTALMKNNLLIKKKLLGK